MTSLADTDVLELWDLGARELDRIYYSKGVHCANGRGDVTKIGTHSTQAQSEFELDLRHKDLSLHIWTDCRHTRITRNS